MKQCFKKEKFIYWQLNLIVVDKKKILEALFDKKIIKILRLFVNNPEKKYYLREISRTVKVSPASTYRILLQIKTLELVNETKDKYLKTYSVNKNNMSFFSDLLEDKKSALQEFIDVVSILSGLKMIIMHGSEEKDKASLLIVGQDVDQEVIRNKAFEIKEKYSFNIIYMVLSQIQYEQMVSMGLYPGKKIILYSK